jgi:class 3 adenylate cyclase
MRTETDQRLPSAIRCDFAQLIGTWQARDKMQWSQNPDKYRGLAEKILQLGEPLLAFDVVSEGLSILPADVRLRQLQGLALARSGATERATAILEQLRDEGQADEETLGMLGRAYKDLAAQAGSPWQREQFLKWAADTYVYAYETTGGYWTGINAATVSLLSGKTDRARELARKVRAECLESLKLKSGNQYWVFAALGEAALILQDWAQAAEWYDRATNQAGRRFGDIHSTRHNARLILQYWNQDPGNIENYLRIPAVIVFVGHMIDRPDRPIPRFPSELESVVAKEIRKKIDMVKPGFGFASAACGSDILFVEAMLDAGAEISVALPYEKEQFIRDNIDYIPNSNWRARFDRALERATRVITASPQKLEIGGVAYEFCNQLLLGLATIRAGQLETTMFPLAVWDGRPGDGLGGTASVVKHWGRCGYEPEVVDLAEIAQREGRVPSRPGNRADIAASPAESSGFASRIVAILFADTIGFSKLNESAVPCFVQHFLGAIAELSAKFGDAIIAKNTWGDGLYFVFSEVDLAGQFALELADLAAKTNWKEKGLPPEISLRIGLHAGPAYEFDDPITDRRTYSGTHVSRAARIEPITPPGQVYASEAFAALAAACDAKNFTCDYVGQTPMAKGYGTLPTYHLRAST